MQKWMAIFVWSTFTVVLLNAAKCSTDEYCPAGWSVKRNPADYAAVTCNPMAVVKKKCEKPYSCVSSKCGISFCCVSDKVLKKIEQQASDERIEPDSEEEL